jgi:anaerobic selenocysteine-containing dehydrogenase
MKDVDKLLRGKIPAPDTGIEVKKSICTICDSPLCGLDLYVKDGKIIKVEGSKEHPAASVRLFQRMASRQYIYYEDC